MVLNFSFPSESHFIDSISNLFMLFELRSKVQLHIVFKIYFLGESEVLIAIFKRIVILFLVLNVFDDLSELHDGQ